jgi:hypothetical protein
MATFLLAFGAGIALEELVAGAPVDRDAMRAMMSRALATGAARAAVATKAARRPSAASPPKRATGPARRKP